MKPPLPAIKDIFTAVDFFGCGWAAHHLWLPMPVVSLTMRS